MADKAQIVKFLVENGADISARDSQEKSALCWASEYRI